ncbi:MAG: preprotein translocase subunit SecA [Ruminococcaceae bacterium]|nr:preprotein translocase subunit SecA [Oscillospiraceae bacterium]
MGIFSKIFGTYSQHQIKKLEPTVNKIEDLADKYSAMSDDELRNQTAVLKQRLEKGETLDDLIPEAFATVREACTRVLGKRPFRVQLMGGIVLHQGRIAEMKTGEGKTIVATMPAYLNALTGEGVHIVTVNEYLARLGAEEMGRVYNFLGLSTGFICHGQTREEKKAAYSADITYGTNNEFGFDYLRDNMVLYKKQKFQRGHVFAIVDEVDSILIDEARTPLIISGEGQKSTELYDKTEGLVSRLRQYRIKELDSKQENDDIDADYIVDEKARSVVLTASGIKKAEEYFGIENLSDAENTLISHHINQAIRAHGIMHRDVDYVVKDGEVLIVDSFTGRIMPGRRYSDGLHQAIEAKEHVKVEKENKTLATVTFQNYFRLYKKLSGMTGTALTEEIEFREIYNLDCVEIPTNKPMIRIDHNDVVYKNVAAKYDAIVRQVVACHEKGQPVLVGTVSIDKSEAISRLLKREGIEHTVLNAKNNEKEAEIVACAGKLGTVTISTNMAGRGTDIMLGGNPEFMAKQEMKKQGYEEDIIGLAVGSSTNVSEEVLAARDVYKELFAKYKEEIAPEAKKVCEVGGLFIVGTERHESRRIDNQLRGRSGRQGDPGESRFYLSLEDDLMRLFGSERVANAVEKIGLPDDQPIQASLLSNSIENAQKQLEGNNFERRKNVLNYDDVMNQQRKVIYAQRDEVLDGANLRDRILNMIREVIDAVVTDAQPNPDDENGSWNFSIIKQEFNGLLCTEDDFDYSEDELKKLKAEDIAESLWEKAQQIYAEKEELFGEEQMREIERVILLRRVDVNWMDQLDAMDDLKGSIGLHAYAQRDPLSMYRIQGADMFDDMIATIRNETVRGVLSVRPREEVKREAAAKVTGEGFVGSGGDSSLKKKPVVKKAAEKIGRNDPCPCGSGKKYKKCCGANLNATDE